MSKNCAEDYLKTIYEISQSSPQVVATTGNVARRMGVSNGTTSSMMRQLAEAGMVVYERYTGSQLTELGLQRALTVIRRQRLIALFFSRTLQLPVGDIDADSQLVGRAASGKLLEQIDKYLGYPVYGLEGLPIPLANGSLPTAALVVLAGCSPGTRFSVAGINDKTPGTADFLQQIGLEVGRRGKVLSNRTTSGLIVVVGDEGQQALSRQVALKVTVSIEPKS